MRINFWKIRLNGFEDYLAVERHYWKPLAEALLKSGRKESWDRRDHDQLRRRGGYRDIVSSWPSF